MTEVLFYHLQRQPLEAVLPTLLVKSLERGWRAVVQATTDERLAALGLVGPRGLVRNEGGGGIGLGETPADNEFGHAARYGRSRCVPQRGRVTQVTPCHPSVTRWWE